MDVIFELVSRPDYIEQLREEILMVVAQEGWTKNSLSKMGKLESFMMECMRLHSSTIRTFTPLARSLPSHFLQRHNRTGTQDHDRFHIQ